MDKAWAVALATVAGLEVYGILTGGTTASGIIRSKTRKTGRALALAWLAVHFLVERDASRSLR